MKYYFIITVDTDTEDHADQVIAERVLHDENYGFNYTIDYEHHVNDERKDA